MWLELTYGTCSGRWGWWWTVVYINVTRPVASSGATCRTRTTEPILRHISIPYVLDVVLRGKSICRLFSWWVLSHSRCRLVLASLPDEKSPRHSLWIVFSFRDSPEARDRQPTSLYFALFPVYRKFLSNTLTVKWYEMLNADDCDAAGGWQKRNSKLALQVCLA